MLPSNLHNELLTSKTNVLLIGHNGLGDNITMSGSIFFLKGIYDNVSMVCKNIHLNNVRLFYPDVDVIPFDKDNETAECIRIAKEFNGDVLIAGFAHKPYIKSRITNQRLLDHIPDHKNYSIQYGFIRDFYTDIGLDLSVYYEMFNLHVHYESLELFNEIPSRFKIVFTHTRSSNKEIDVSSCYNIDDENSLIICANKNVYVQDGIKKTIADKFVNIPVAYYYPTILNADEIYVVDSCFACIVYPLNQMKRLKARRVQIFSR